MYTILLAVALIDAPPAVSEAVSAVQLDGTTLTGELQSWDLDHVTLRSADGEQSLATKGLIALRRPPPPAPDDAGPAAFVELVDGSLLPLKEFRSSESEATLTLSAPASGNDRRLRLPRRQLAAVRLQRLEPAAARQWDEIRGLQLVSDVLVVLRRDGTSLDYVEGVLGDVSAERIEFNLDGEPLRIDRARVAGFLYYQAGRDAAAEPRCTVHGRSGLRANVADLHLQDGTLELKSVAGTQFDWPLDDIYWADYSAGKLLYLSDLTPAVEQWTPLVALPTAATLAAEYGRPRRDQSAYGGPLSLGVGDPLATSPVAPPRTYEKGLALRSRTELVYRLPAGFQRLSAMAGIDPATSASGNVRLTIEGDDRPLLEMDIAGHDPPLPIDVDLSGARRLRILVDYGQNLDTGDWLNLCDVRVIK